VIEWEVKEKIVYRNAPPQDGRKKKRIPGANMRGTLINGEEVTKEESEES
jgi:hypothetical protein